MQPASSLHPSAPISPWLVFPEPNAEAETRLFCFPYAGAGPVVYRAWPESLPHTVEVVTVHYPGRESRFREPLFETLQPLVDTLAGHILPTLDRPYAFFGHSMGALVAFELTRKLRALGARLPAHLFVSARRAPHIPERLPPIHTLEDAAFTAAVQQRYNGIPPVILEDAELLALFLPMLKADFSVIETYRYTPEAPFDFPITTFVGLQDPGTNQQEMDGWQAHTTRPLGRYSFPGDHFYLQNQRSALLQAVSTSLNGK